MAMAWITYIECVVRLSELLYHCELTQAPVRTFAASGCSHGSSHQLHGTQGAHAHSGCMERDTNEAMLAPTVSQRSMRGHCPAESPAQACRAGRAPNIASRDAAAHAASSKQQAVAAVARSAHANHDAAWPIWHNMASMDVGLPTSPRVMQPPTQRTVPSCQLQAASSRSSRAKRKPN